MTNGRPNRGPERAARGATRGFTLLETVTAMMVAGVILAAVLGMLGTIESMDARMQARFDDAAALARARTVVARSLDTLWMSSEAQRAPEALKDARDLPPARFVLETDRSPTAVRASRRVLYAGAGASPPMQRLEVVVSRWPVPLDYGLLLGRGAEWSEHQQIRGSSLRCAFELRPDEGTGTSDGPPAWTLWWRPLPLAEHGGASARAADPTRDRNAIPLISGLTRCVWTVFDDRQRLSELKGIWSVDLPAYVELDLATAGGQVGNWVFEVGWASGPEVKGEEPSAPGEPDEKPRGGNNRGGRGGR